MNPNISLLKQEAQHSHANGQTVCFSARAQEINALTSTQDSRKVVLEASSAVGNNTASAASLNDIPHNVRMCDFAADTATRVRRLICIVGDGVAITKLRHEAIDRSIVRSVRIGA